MGDPTAGEQAPKLPPAWFKHAFWRVHRVLHRVSGGRLLWTPRSKRGWGAMALTAVGRRSGQPRTVIVGYLEDGTMVVVENGRSQIGQTVQVSVTSTLQTSAGRLVFAKPATAA